MFGKRRLEERITALEQRLQEATKAPMLKREQLSQEASNLIRKHMGLCPVCRGFHFTGICPRIASSHIERNIQGVPTVEEYHYHLPGSGWEEEIIAPEQLVPEEMTDDTTS